MPLKIVRSDIVDMHADAIVNTANAYPVIGSGVDETIYEAAGREELIADRVAIGVSLVLGWLDGLLVL